MRQDAQRDLIVTGLKRVIHATFNEDKWEELGYLTGTREVIVRHPRLLRSLRFGDDDYGACIFEVLPEILGPNMENLAEVETFTDAEEWLSLNDPRMYSQLYTGLAGPVKSLEEAIQAHNVAELNQQVARIMKSINDDPALAIGSSKELLETVMKTILGDGNYGRDDDIPKLLKMTQTRLHLDPKTTPAIGVLSRTLSNLGQVVVGVDEVRNLVGTGHGRSGGPQVDSIHAELVVNAAAAIGTYFLRVWEQRRAAERQYKN